MSKWKISIFTISPTHALFFQREEKYTEQVRCDQSVCSCVCVFTSVGVICKAKPFNYSHVFIIHNDKSLSIPLFCRRILCNFAIILRVAIRRWRQPDKIEEKRNGWTLFQCSINMEQAARLLEGVHNFCAMHSQSEHANKFNHDILAKKRRKITGSEKEEERERETLTTIRYVQYACIA